MSLTTTTLSSAVAVTDTSIVVGSASGFAANNLVLVDQEVMLVGKGYSSGTTIPVERGQNGSVTAAHAASANAVTMLASDETAFGPQTAVQWPVAGRARTLTSYSATGAITLPTPGTDAIAVLNGTGTLAMTLAVPTKDMDGCILYIQGNGKSASTVTFATAIGNAGSGYTVITFQNAGAVGISLMAINGIWNLIGTPITGTTTKVSVAIS